MRDNVALHFSGPRGLQLRQPFFPLFLDFLFGLGAIHGRGGDTANK
jgi:hypothetical protein